MPDFTAASDARRGHVPFVSWFGEVVRLFDAGDDADAVVAVLHGGLFGALSRLYQVEELSPREVVEGVEAALAFAEAAEVSEPEVPAAVQEARDAEDDDAEDRYASADPVRDADDYPTQTDGRLESQDPEADEDAVVVGSDDPQAFDADRPEDEDEAPSFGGSQVFGKDGPEDEQRSSDPRPEAPYTPSDEHPAVERQNFGPPQDEV